MPIINVDLPGTNWSSKERIDQIHATKSLSALGACVEPTLVALIHVLQPLTVFLELSPKHNLQYML